MGNPCGDEGLRWVGEERAGRLGSETEVTRCPDGLALRSDGGWTPGFTVRRLSRGSCHSQRMEIGEGPSFSFLLFFIRKEN